MPRLWQMPSQPAIDACRASQPSVHAEPASHRCMPSQPAIGACRASQPSEHAKRASYRRTLSHNVCQGFGKASKPSAHDKPSEHAGLLLGLASVTSTKPLQHGIPVCGSLANLSWFAGVHSATNIMQCMPMNDYSDTQKTSGSVLVKQE